MTTSCPIFGLSAPLDPSLSLQAALLQLTERIRQAATAAGMNTAGKPEGREPWWDWECSREREKSFALLNLLRVTNSNMTRAAYLRQNARFKDTCQRKETEYYKGLASRLADARDGSEFWSLVRSLRPRVQRRIGDIPMWEWVQHFRRQWSMEGKLEIAYEYVAPLAPNVAMDCPIYCE